MSTGSTVGLGVFKKPEVIRKRSASPAPSPAARKMPRKGQLEDTTAAETEAIAVLEHFKNAGGV